MQDTVSGVFTEDEPRIVLTLTVNNKRNVYIQALLDCNISYAKDEQFLCVNLIDTNQEYVLPRLPNDYKPKRASNYSHNGYLFNLEAGEYQIEIISYLYSIGRPSVKDGTSWMVKAVAKDTHLEKFN